MYSKSPDDAVFQQIALAYSKVGLCLHIGYCKILLFFALKLFLMLLNGFLNLFNHHEWSNDKIIYDWVIEDQSLLQRTLPLTKTPVFFPSPNYFLQYSGHVFSSWLNFPLFLSGSLSLSFCECTSFLNILQVFPL